MFLLKRNLTYFWRTNAAVVAGVAVAVAVLAGALMVGDSVRTSLRNIFLQQLGHTSHVINSSTFFREKLAEDVSADERFASAGFGAVCPIIVLEGSVTHEATGRRSARVRVYGVDERFWKFHQRQSRALGDRDALSSPGLARELGAKDGDALLLRVTMPSAIPLESLHSRKEDSGRTLRLNLKGVLPAEEEGEFSVNPQQTATRAVFVSLQLLQRELEQPSKANTLLVSEKADPGNTAVLEKILKDKSSLEDMGIRLRIVNEQSAISIETESAIISDTLADTSRAAAAESNAKVLPVLSYLANSIKSGNEIPYSLVTAIDDESFAQLRSTGTVTSASASASPPLVLNEWAARELKVSPGAEVTLDYYLWQPDGSLVTKTAQFSLVGVVPIAGIAADRQLVPEYPGITESESIADWDPPFPIDLARVTKRDEDYWKQYRTTPKAFIPLSTAQKLWGTRFGKHTSLRVFPSAGSTTQSTLDNFRVSLKAKLDPTQMGLVVFPARAGGLEASKGATDFGEYFLYFSFFLVVSALMLAVLFFKLGVEQRLREIGTLQAIGFSMSTIRWLFLSEGLLLAAIGSLLGLGLALAYGKLMIFGLTTWWVEAVGTTALRLHVTAFSLIIGAVGGILAALLCIAVTLRGLKKASTRSLLHGVSGAIATGSSSNRADKKASLVFGYPLFFPILFGALGLALVLLAMFGVVGKAAGFFGGGTLLLIALLSYQWTWLRRDRRKAISGNGWLPVIRMGLRNASSRPARSVLCISLIASATFIIVAVDAFRRDPKSVALDKNSGSGGFVLLGEADLPIVYDPNTEAGRESLNLTAAQNPDPMANVSITRFRLRPGDDASCLNLYQPRNPRILGATDEFIRSSRFAFQDSIAESAEEKANPWLLLNRDLGNGVVPVIADANSMTYVLHRKLGDEMTLDQGSGPPLRLRFVAALSDSLFQSELVMSEKNFLRVFPSQQGYRVFLIEAPGSADPADPAAIAGTLEDRLSDFGFDAVSTAERLAEFHRVENTYLSTFQMLGGLGLALGTLGLGAVLLRNVLERRRELALLRAVGYNRKHLAVMVVAENAFLLFSGLLIGFESAMLAIAPVTYERGGAVPYVSLGTLLLVVAIVGLVASLIATAAVIRSPLIPALKEE